MEAFWRAVEQTVAAGHLVPADSHLSIDGALTNTVIILPRIVTRLHPVHHAPEQHIYRYVSRKKTPCFVNFAVSQEQSKCVSAVFLPVYFACRDLAAWDANFVIQILQEFLRVSSAKTFPSLAEYSILPDKVCLLLQHCVRCLLTV